MLIVKSLKVFFDQSKKILTQKKQQYPYQFVIKCADQNNLKNSLDIHRKISLIIFNEI